jgi:hypothetical protein
MALWPHEGASREPLFKGNLITQKNLDFGLPLIELDCSGDLDVLSFKGPQVLPSQICLSRNPTGETLVWVDTSKVDEGIPLLALETAVTTPSTVTFFPTYILASQAEIVGVSA